MLYQDDINILLEHEELYLSVIVSYVDLDTDAKLVPVHHSEERYNVRRVGPAV
jgi:hypothetical protein